MQSKHQLSVVPSSNQPAVPKSKWCQRTVKTTITAHRVYAYTIVHNKVAVAHSCDSHAAACRLMMSGIAWCAISTCCIHGEIVPNI